MGALDKLKKNRADLFNKVAADFEKKDGKFEKKEDDRFWQPTRDTKTGAGAAIIRFLPPVVDGDELPWARLYSYAFKDKKTGKWYIENSLRTIGKPDPVGEYNHERWEESLALSGDEQKKAQDAVRDRKQKTTYISNILVVRDPAKPENEGKVFLYKYGPQIHGMIQAQAQPEKDEFAEEDPTPVFVYDAFEGKNFRLKVKMKDKYPNYEDSKFEDKITALCDGDEDEMEAVLSKCHSLNAFLDPKEFKSYDDLKKQLHKALGLTGGTASGGSSSGGGKKSALEQMDDDEPQPTRTKVTSGATKKPKEEPKEEPAGGDDDGDDTDFFKKLLSEE
jgi:hypothetical protein